MARRDPHSYYDDAQPRTASLELRVEADFDRRVLEGEATLTLAAPGSGPFDLDAKALEIASVRDAEGRAVPFELGATDPILGERLWLQLAPGTRAVTIAYRTSPDAAALQWLAPEQTRGGRHPFLFSQCQAIHARSMVPVQDTPFVRIPYVAEVTLPEPLSAVMSAGPGGTRPGPRPGTRTLRFEMPQPIPPYLLALAAGHLESRDLGPRTRVWAEPETVEAAAWEFAEVEDHVRTAEGLFGPYDWDRYDMLVLPPSFPYGGMENPRMTFLTPTLLAGDRSLVDVVAHELAHSWTGNLVTNANMEHFWLNEGFTVYAERRILEALHGPEAAARGWAIGQRALDDALARFADKPDHTKLRTELAGVDPDDVFSQIPYEKGARFVVLLERAVGRARFDAFLRAYMARFRFGALTTEEFLAFLEEQLPGVAAQVDARAWLYEPGIPANAPRFESAALQDLEARAAGFASGVRPSAEEIRSWSPTHLMVYLQKLPRPLDHDGLRWLDATFGLTRSTNYEILVEWLVIAAGSGYEPVFPRVREVLTSVGRMKYLRPLYTALAKNDATRELARAIFAEAAPGYHQLSRRVVQSVLA